MDFHALSRHGYRGGPAVPTVAPPKVESNSTWSIEKDHDEKKVLIESYEEREHIRAAVTFFFFKMRVYPDLCINRCTQTFSAKIRNIKFKNH